MPQELTLEDALKQLCEEYDLADIFETLATILDEQREASEAYGVCVHDRDRVTRLLEDASRILRQLDR